MTMARTTTWPGQIAVVLVLLASSMASGATGLLGGNSPLGKNALEGELHRGSASASAETHQGCGDLKPQDAAGLFVAPRTTLGDMSFSKASRQAGGEFGAARLQAMRDAVNARSGRLRIVIGDSSTTWERQMAQGMIRDAERAGHSTNAVIRRFEDGSVYIAFRNSSVTRAEVLEELYHAGQIRTGWWDAGFAARETQAGAHLYRAYLRGLITEQEYLDTIANISGHLNNADPRAVHQLIEQINADHLRRGTRPPRSP